jgi:hypothetical protein
MDFSGAAVAGRDGLETGSGSAQPLDKILN